MNRELVRAFNIILCHNEVAITNLTVQSTDQTFFKKEDRIVISFDKNMDVGQCMEYLHNIKESIVETFFGSESGANMSFNTKFFPFNFNESQLTKDKEGYKFLVPIDKGVVFNLKCLLAHGLAKDAKEDMGNEFGERCMEGRVYDVSFDRKSYLYCMQFYDKRLQDYFVESFSSRIKNYKNGPKKTDDFLKIKGNCVYIKESIFNNAEFIKDIVEHKASLECRDFEVTSAEDETVESLKFSVIDLLRKVGILINSILHVSYTGNSENSVLIPATKEVIGNIIYYKVLSKEQADDINKVFGMTVLNNVEDCTSPKHLPVFGNGGVYGIDFYDKDISYCVLNKIMESSVINKDHELSVDPELVRVLSPAQSPVRVPNGPSSYFTEPLSPTQEFPTQSHGEELERPPRRGSEKEGLLYCHVNPDGPSKGFSPSPQMNSTAVSQRTGKCVSAAQNVQAGTNPWAQRMNPCLSQGTSGNKWQPSPEPGPSGLSWTGANPVGTNPWSQPMGAWSSPAPSAGFSSWSPSGSLSPLQPIKSGPDCSFRQESPQVFMVNKSSSSRWEISNKPLPSNKLNEKEKELIEALLYTLNLTNYTFDGVYTNFFAKGEEKARKVYDLNEFPFKFLSNCEKNQETTVVANISRGALLNLKKFFSQKRNEGEMEIKNIDINIVEKDVQSKIKAWLRCETRGEGMKKERGCKKVNFKVSSTVCYPDKSALERIPIKGFGVGYRLDRNYDYDETQSLRKNPGPAKGKSKAKKMQHEDNKDSGYSSGFVTDMDCENTGGGSPKRTLELGMENLGISTQLGTTNIEQPYSPAKKSRSN